MTLKKIEPAFSHEGPQEAADAPMTGRRPWIAPALERLDLREAMAAIGSGSFDGVGSS
jgi:hypothetical protein